MTKYSIKLTDRVVYLSCVTFPIFSDYRSARELIRTPFSPDILCLSSQMSIRRLFRLVAAANWLDTTIAIGFSNDVAQAQTNAKYFVSRNRLTVQEQTPS